MAYERNEQGGEIESARIGPWSLGRRALMIGAPVAIVGIGAAAAAVIMATGPKPEKKTDPVKPPAVQVATVEARTMSITVSAQGQVQPRVDATLAAQAAGRVVWTSPNFANGGAFRQGEVLIRIDPADYQLAVTRAKAQVAQAKEGLAREEAESELARQDWKELGKGEPSPLVLREPQLAQASAALAAAEAALKSAELDLARTAVTAPFSGRVKAQMAKVGDYMGPGAPVGEIFATDVMEVRIPLTDTDLGHLATPPGFIARSNADARTAHLTAVVAGAERKWEGRLVRTEANVDPQTRLVYGVVEVRGAFDAKNSAPLAPGLFVTAVLDGSNKEDIFAAPRSALKRNQDIYVVRADDTIDLRTITPLQTSATEVFFRGGLSAGERVVVSHLPSPRQGMKVTPIARSAEAAPVATTPAANPAR
jgi:RND family efflux transporter MFP subunit